MNGIHQCAGFERVKDLLDTEEKVKDARATLERNTEENFKQLESGKMSSREHSHRVFLD
jgi:hypothetical protein